jgi:hypothetical protein
MQYRQRVSDPAIDVIPVAAELDLLPVVEMDPASLQGAVGRDPTAQLPVSVTYLTKTFAS